MPFIYLLYLNYNNSKISMFNKTLNQMLTPTIMVVELFIFFANNLTKLRLYNLTRRDLLLDTISLLMSVSSICLLHYWIAEQIN